MERRDLGETLKKFMQLKRCAKTEIVRLGLGHAGSAPTCWSGPAFRAGPDLYPAEESAARQVSKALFFPDECGRTFLETPLMGGLIQIVNVSGIFFGPL